MRLTPKATPSYTSVSGPGFFQRPCGWVVNQHHSNQYKPIRPPSNANFFICASLCACSIQTAENLEIAKSMRVGDQKQKYDLKWPNNHHKPSLITVIMLIPVSALYRSPSSFTVKGLVPQTSMIDSYYGWGGGGGGGYGH